MNQEVDPHQMPNMPASSSWIFQPLEMWQISFCCLLATQSTVFLLQHPKWTTIDADRENTERSLLVLVQGVGKWMQNSQQDSGTPLVFSLYLSHSLALRQCCGVRVAAALTAEAVGASKRQYPKKRNVPWSLMELQLQKVDSDLMALFPSLSCCHLAPKTGAVVEVHRE